MTTQPHAPVRSVSDYQRDVLQALADGYTLEVLAHDGRGEYTLMKDGEVAMPLNSPGTFFALRPYLALTHKDRGHSRYGINDAGRDVLSNGVKQL